MSGSYRFEPTTEGFAVYYRGRKIGEIFPAKESSGRHCFYLSFDDRARPRTYRGKTKAAEALHAIQRLTAAAKKRRWRSEKLVLMAWDQRPRASETP